ncbi:MAG: hypothetical protein IPH36_02535 [Saprospiraceae bacterium]|nr:hypothetical protein [Saprospiraceae bacterium]
MMSAILENLNFLSTVEKEPCTQDNPKKMNPNELTHYFRDALQFSISGGSVEVKISSGLITQLSWHPYLSTIFSHFNLIDDELLLSTKGGGIDKQRHKGRKWAKILFRSASFPRRHPTIECAKPYGLEYS